MADVLLEAGLSNEQLELYLKHLLFSWMVGNGDLHAKNVSIVTWLSPGQLGAAPAPHAVSYSPLYDLVNTRIHIPGDRFAFPVNGKNDKLKVKDFAVVATRWGLEKGVVANIAQELANSIRKELDEVLELSGLPMEHRTNYSSVVDANLTSMKL